MGMINLLIRNQDLLHHTGTELYQPVWFKPRLVPATRPLKSFTRGDWSRGLVRLWTVHTKRFEKQVAGTCPKNSNWFEFVKQESGTKVGPGLDYQPLFGKGARERERAAEIEPKLVPATRFWSKNGQFTWWDLSPRLVAGTSRRN